MNRFWRKQIPAAVLTLIMMIGLVPAAMAESVCPGAASGVHSWTDWTTRVAPTCTNIGAVQRHCRSCDAVDETAVPALGHDFGGLGQVTAAPTCTAAGTMLIKCSRCDATTSRAVPALGHNYVNGVCSVCGDRNGSAPVNPTPSATKNFSLTVEPSDEVTVGRTIRNNIGAYETILFSDISGTSYGRLYATSGKASLSTSSAYTYAETSKLYFIASSREGSYNVSYTAVLSDKSTVSGKITIRVAASAVKDGVITYNVKPGESVDFSVEDFLKLYEDKLDGTARYMTLSTSSTISKSNGTVYYNYDEKGEVAFSKSSLSDNDYYFSSSRYGDYPVEDLSFVVPSDAKEQTVTFTCKIFDSDRDSVTGTLKIVISKPASSVKNGVITYNVKAGESIDFSAADFEALYDEELDGSIRYVTLSTGASINSTNGTVYYNYGKSGQIAFNKSTISDNDYYFTRSAYGDYPIGSLTYAAPKNAKSQTITLNCKVYDSDRESVSGTVKIVVSGSSSSSSSGDISYSVKPGESVDFKLSDFREVYEKELDGEILYVTFSTSSSLSEKNGTVYANYGEKDAVSFTGSSIEEYKFYYGKVSGDNYALRDLSYAAPKSASEKTVTLTCKIFDDDGYCVLSTVRIEVSNLTQSSTTGDIIYRMDKNDTYDFDRDDFNEFFQKKYSLYDFKYITFETDDTLSKNTGLLYYDYEGKNEESFDDSDLDDDLEFSYSASGDYPVNKLTFVTGKSFDEPITLYFTAYNSSNSVSGTLVITPEEEISAVEGDILYLAAYNGNVQINPNHFARFLSKKYPTSTLQTVTLNGTPSMGSLYYNYYGTSPYGLPKQLLNDSNCKDLDLYFSPSSASQYSLSELTYVPKGANYCVSIPFTAYGSGGKHADGTLLISISLAAVPEVYSVTQKNTAISLPAASIAASVLASTGTNPSAIQFLKLPDTSVGTLYVGSGTSLKASTSDLYGNTVGTYKMNQLRFVPAANYTGSVELPYVAVNSNGTPIAAGKFCLGVLADQKSFTDIAPTTWCYKYVTELTSAGIIAGYGDNTFKEKSTITYGAALKLVMLAAGYSEQAPTGTNVFSGYLTRAQADGLITDKNVNLAGPITRLQIARLAAAALKLDTRNLSALQPFTDTTDASVRALNAAGIIEGYFANGTSTFKPNNTLTRGHVSAIVWRMRNLNK